MYVAMIGVNLANGTEGDLARHIEDTNKILSKIDGFVSRRLLKSQDGSYRILVEHKSQETFARMHQNPEHDKARAELFELIDPAVERSVYTVLAS